MYRILLNLASHLREKDIEDDFFFDEIDLLVSLVGDSRRLTNLFTIADSVEGGTYGCEDCETCDL